MIKLRIAGIFSILLALLVMPPAVHAEAPAKNSNTAGVPASMVPSDIRPNAPSLARTEGHRDLAVTDWENPEICGGCHTTQYQGWKGSMHSNAFKDPIFQAEWALAEQQIGGNISNLCSGCHSPPGMLSKSIEFDPELGKNGGFTAPVVARQGVSCDVCHTNSGSSFRNSEVMEHGNGSYIAAPGKTKRGPLKDAKSPYHDTVYSEHHTRAAFCGNCHNIFNPVNQFPLERTYDEWKYSVYAQHDVQCQDCHMVPVETAMRVADELKPARELKDHGLAGKAAIGALQDRELTHGHGFVGGNSVITAALGDPDSRRHAKIAIKRLRSAARLDVKLNKVAGQGDLHQLEVKVTNQRAGHHMPTSLTFIRELWLDITVTDQDDNEVFRSGALDEHSEVDPEAVMFKAYAVDKDGKPAKYIWTVARFDRRTTIPPKGHQYGRYFFNVPAGTKTLNVQTRLNYRSFSQHFVDHLLGEGKMKVPTVTMNDIKTVYQIPGLKVVETVDFTASSDAEKESNRLLEEYLGPEVAMKDIDKLTNACAACHGKQGISREDVYPNIGGQNEAYLLSALRAYQSGSREEPRMNAMTKDLTDQQLQELAAHYAKLVRDPEGKNQGGSE